jgi:hypothetical protein
MYKAFRVTAAMAVIGIAALSFTARAQAGNGSAVGAGLVGFGIGAILGSALAPEVYVGPPPPYYYGPMVYGPPPPYDYYGDDYYGDDYYGDDYYGDDYYGDDYYGPGGYGPPEGRRKSYSYRAPVHTSPNAAGHEPRPGPTRSTTVKTGAATRAVESKSEAKFKAAQAKAKLGGVDTLTQKDIDGLSREQMKQLRGY